MPMARPLVREMTRPMVRRLVRGEHAPLETVIDAPINVTYIPESNAPAYNMIIPDTGDGAVEVGDEPVKRYNGAGTEYVGDPVDAIPPTQPLTGFGDSALPPGTAAGYVQFKFRRADGLGGYIDGAWSSASEGAYPAIPSAGAPDQFETGDWGIDANGTPGGATITLTNIPNDNGDAITDVQFQADGGSWATIGGTTPGDYDVTGNGLAAGVLSDVAIRAVNGIGEGTASTTKPVTPLVDNVIYSNDGSSDDGSIIPYAAGTTIAYVSGHIEITNVDPWSLARVYPDGADIVVIIGHTYRLSWVRGGSIALACYGGHPGGSFNDLFIGPEGAGAQSVEFEATATAFELFLGPASGSVGATVIVDDIVLEDIT